MRRIFFGNSDAPTDLYAQDALDPERWKITYVDTDFMPFISIPKEVIAKNAETEVPLSILDLPKRVTRAEKFIPQELINKSMEQAKKVDLVRKASVDELKAVAKREKFGRMYVDKKGKVVDGSDIAQNNLERQQIAKPKEKKQKEDPEKKRKRRKEE